MNTLYKDLYRITVEQRINEGESDAWVRVRRYTELIVQECVNKMSDYLDKQRVLKHFGMEEI